MTKLEELEAAVKRGRKPKYASPSEAISARSITDGNGCWIWQQSTRSGRYGHIHWRGRAMLAHRFSYEHFKGPIGIGLTIDHLCREPLCVNPMHLEAVSNWENTKRSSNPIAALAKKTTCNQGHALVVMSGRRRCVECRRDENRRFNDKKREAKKSASVTLDGFEKTYLRGTSDRVICIPRVRADALLAVARAAKLIVAHHDKSTCRLKHLGDKSCPWCDVIDALAALEGEAK